MYGKVFDSIYDGTLYGHWQAIVTMQQLIVLASPDGVVDMTPHAIAARTSIPLKIITKGLEFLAQPDPLARHVEQINGHIRRLASGGAVICGYERLCWEGRQHPAAWRLTRAFILERDGFRCRYCGASNEPLECDHVYPVSRGGSNDPDNLATACQICNRAKGSQTPEEWRAKA